MRRSLIVLAVLVIVLVAVQVALAGGGDAKAGHGHAWGKAKFQLNATIVSIDPATGVVTVLVKNGSRQVKAFRGLELPLTVAVDARFVDATAEDDDAPASLTAADLVAGMKVHVGGRIDRTDPASPIFIARKIIVKSWPSVTPPEPTPEPSPSPTDITPEPTPSATEG